MATLLAGFAGPGAVKEVFDGKDILDTDLPSLVKDFDDLLAWDDANLGVDIGVGVYGVGLAVFYISLARQHIMAHSITFHSFQG